MTDPELEQLVREELREAADQIEPAADGLARIRDRIREGEEDCA